jgi:histidyl-tRNA synthetase
MKRADKVDATVAVILGDNELDQRQATVKDLGTGTQTAVALDRLAEALETYR